MTTVGTTHTDTRRAPTPIGFGWLPGALVVIAVIAVAVAALYMALSGDEGTSPTAVEAEGPAASLGEVYNGDLLLAKLANEGLIPHAAVDWETVELMRLANLGLIPAATLEPAAVSVEPLFTERELLEIDLANRGLIPSQSIDSEMIELKRLVNLGLIPAAALEPAAVSVEPLFTEQELLETDFGNLP